MTAVTGARERADELLLRILVTPEGRADPYPLYRELRSLAPVHRGVLAPAWFLTRYEDSRAMLCDERFGKSSSQSTACSASSPAAS